MRKTIAFALALLGLFVSIYLLWVYASPSHPMVCLGTGCDEVRASVYAHFLGIPTPAYGVAFYSVLALLLFAEAAGLSSLYSYRAGKSKNARIVAMRTIILTFSGIGVVVSAALTYIEAAVVHAWCAWCVTQAVAVTLIFLLWLAIYFAERSGRREMASTGTYLNVVIGAVAIGCIAFYLLQRAESKLPPPPPAMEVIAAKLVRPESHVIGNPQSSVTFVEFGDLQCPACVASYPIVQQLRQRYGDRVRFVFREFPLESIHMYAMGAAQAAECAGRQGRFWQALDRMYEAKGALDDPSLMSYAKEIGLDMAQFRQCLASDETLPAIRRDQQDGMELGVRPTPTFFVGKRRIEGALTFEQFATLLEEDLKAAPQGASAPPAPEASTPSKPPAKEEKKKEEKKEEKKPQETAGSTLPGASGGGFFTIKGASTDCSEDAPKGPEPPLIHTADAKQKLDQGAVFVDVRAADDFGKGHIKSARSVPLLEVERRAGELPKDKPVVVYEGGTAAAGDVCAAAKSAARVLISRGYKAVVYQDGLKDWEKTGGAVEK